LVSAAGIFRLFAPSDSAKSPRLDTFAMQAASFEQFRRVKRFGSLDALRCISIVVVIFSHTASVSMPWLESQLVGLAGVRLFFAISGFLITTLLLREREATGGISLRNFVVRRTLRIFPLYYTILFAYIVLVFLTERHDEAGAQFFRNLPFFFTYTSNLFVNNHPASGADRVLFLFSWSLATEEQFYLIWPTIEKFAGDWLAAIIMVGVVLLLITYRLCVASGVAVLPGFAGMFVGSISLSICMGVLIAHALHSPAGYRALAKIWTPFNSLIGLFVLVLLVSCSQSEILKSVASAFVVLSCVQSERHILAGLFRWKPLVAIGSVSYGMYLMHLLCNHTIRLVAGRVHLSGLAAGGWLEFAATTVVSFVVAMISFRYYESIFLRLKTKFEPARAVPHPAQVHEPLTPAPIAAAAY
jgi:peptidoglycan/LPS O-acetylase OafA/YrhL